MPFFDTQSREQLRQLYFDAWRKRRERLPLQPLEAQVAEVIEAHPEYHALFTDTQALSQDWTPADGESNPFLHMGLHLAVREQLATDRPAGIRAAFQKLCKRVQQHEAEHVLLEKLAETLWQAQRSGVAPDEQAYLAKIKSAAN